eukprot:3268157-Rhodomonas_salina.1
MVWLVGIGFCVCAGARVRVGRGEVVRPEGGTSRAQRLGPGRSPTPQNQWQIQETAFSVQLYQECDFLTLSSQCSSPGPIRSNAHSVGG